MWTGVEIRGRRVPDSDRIPPSPPPHQVSTNTRSANTKLIKFVLNLRYDTFILTQRGGGNWSQFRVLGATIVCCHFIFCSAIIVPVILAKAGTWARCLRARNHQRNPFPGPRPDVSNYLSCQQAPSPLSLYLSLHPFLSPDYPETLLIASSCQIFTIAQINCCIVRR